MNYVLVRKTIDESKRNIATRWGEQNNPTNGFLACKTFEQKHPA